MNVTELIIFCEFAVLRFCDFAIFFVKNNFYIINNYIVNS